MAITTYAELQTAVGGWSTWSGNEDRIPEFIALAEARANRLLDCRHNRARDASFSIAAASVALPDGFSGVLAFHLNTTPPTALVYVKPDAFDDPYDAGYPLSGKPLKYTVLGDSFHFSPAPDSTYAATLVYRTILTPLSDAAPTNWLLANHPDAYLNGALEQAYRYMEDDGEESKFKSLFEQNIADINIEHERYGQGSAPARRVRGFV